MEDWALESGDIGPTSRDGGRSEDRPRGQGVNPECAHEETPIKPEDTVTGRSVTLAKHLDVPGGDTRGCREGRARKPRAWDVLGPLPRRLFDRSRVVSFMIKR